MSATDHTLTAPERENIEELLRLHVLADDEQIVYDLFETLLTQRGVTYEARLATAEAEKEALRERVGRLEAQLAEVRRTSRVLPCDGLCSEYPEEDCSLHGREPAELWEAIAEKNKRAEAAEAALTGLVAEVESLAEASLQDGRGGAWVHDVWFRALIDADHAAALRAEKAKALREAADDLLQVGLPSPSRREVHVWLRDRADSIEQAHP